MSNTVKLNSIHFCGESLSDLWLTDITDANGNKTGYTYANGELSTQFADVNKNGVCDEGEPVVDYTYDAWGNITAVETETASYTFAYNDANLPLAVYVAGNEAPLVTYLYNSTLTESTGIQYANGLTVTYEYDTIGNISKVLENGVAVAEYEYDSNMNLIGALEDGTETTYCYDEAGTLLYTGKTCNGHTVVTYSETDEETGETRYITKLDGAEIVYKSVYDEENDISKYVLPNLAEITSDEDDFGRTKNVYLKDSDGNNLLSCTYSYVDKQLESGLATSEYISSMTYTNGKSYTYTYDAVGNIISVSDGTYTTSYVYDSLYQLIRENNEKLDATWTYTYDTAGNILSKSEYDYTVGELGTAVDTISYTYDSVWGDQLVNYDGTAITYDAQGNPLNWRDGLSFTWSGRELSSIVEGTKVYTYEYNADGIRTKTIITDTEDADYSLTYEYILDENNNVIAVFRNGSAYGEYYFDESGSPIGYRYNNTDYWYTKNLQGDITRVESEDGELYVEYDYDAWGNFTVDFSDSRARLAIERVNIYTYRGYIYDRDTDLYYLQSRYYDPAVGRFINADDIDYLGASGTELGYNLYVYCHNNVVNGMDHNGYDAIWLQDRTAVGGLGHSGLLIEDRNGEWYHIYWGNNRNGLSGKKGYGNMVMHFRFKDVRTRTPTLMEINVFYQRYYGGRYEGGIYLKGSFVNGLNYARNLRSQKYNLLFNNCVQVTIDILRKGVFFYNDKQTKSFLYYLRAEMIPNYVYECLFSYMRRNGSIAV